MEDVIKKTEEVLFHPQQYHRQHPHQYHRQHPHQCHRQHPHPHIITSYQLKIIALLSQLCLDFHYIVLMEINRGIMNKIVVIINILSRSHPQGSPANEHHGAPPRKS